MTIVESSDLPSLFDARLDVDVLNALVESSEHLNYMRHSSYS